MNTAPRRLLPGILLIVLGVFFLLSNLTEVDISGFWPLLLLAPGIYFFVLYFINRTDFGVLMPATVLTIIGLLFLYCEYAGWGAMHYLWPLFMLAPGIGFFLMYFLGKRERGFLIPGGILTGLAVLFLINLQDSDVFWPVILILAGLLLLISRSSRPAVREGLNEHPPTTAQ